MSAVNSFPAALVSQLHGGSCILGSCSSFCTDGTASYFRVCSFLCHSAYDLYCGSHSELKSVLLLNMTPFKAPRSGAALGATSTFPCLGIFFLPHSYLSASVYLQELTLSSVSKHERRQSQDRKTFRLSSSSTPAVLAHQALPKGRVLQVPSHYPL